MDTFSSLISIYFNFYNLKKKYPVSVKINVLLTPGQVSPRDYLLGVPTMPAQMEESYVELGQS